MFVQLGFSLIVQVERVAQGFGSLAISIRDAPFGEIVGCQFDRDPVAGENADVMLPHFAGNVRHNDMTIFEFNSKGCIGERFGNHSLHLYGFFLCHKLFQ